MTSSDESLDLLIAIVEHGSFQRAADASGVPRSTISKRISALEHKLGARLLQRNSHVVSLTPAGRVYFEYGKRAAEAMAEARRLIGEMRSEPVGTVRVTCAVMIGITALIPSLSRFSRLHPRVKIDLSLSDRIEDLVASGFDVAIRMGPMPDSALIGRKIMAARRIICASPDYIAAFGCPKTPEELMAHNCLNLTTLGRDSNEWTFEQNGSRTKVAVRGNFATDSGAGHYAAIAAGLGIGRVTYLNSLTDIAAGRLVPLLTEFEVTELSPIYAVMPSGRHVSPGTRAFFDYLIGLGSREHGCTPAVDG